MRNVSSLLALVLCAACGDERERDVAPPSPQKPVRGAAGDRDLRVMLAELASAQACKRIEDRFVGLRAPDRPDVTTGVLWLRDCTIKNDGTQVTFALGGQGWQWTERKTEKAGAEFELREYVKFDVDATMRGTVDMAYDPKQHIATVWFTPTAPPRISFKPIGDVDVDEEGVWASIVGGVAGVVGESPDTRGKKQAKREGREAFEEKLGEGMTVAVDLCTGYQRFSLGRHAKGTLGPPAPGETRAQKIEIQPNGLLVFGPYQAPKGMTVSIRSNGVLRAGLACMDEVDKAANAFLRENTPKLVDTIAKTDVKGEGTLSIDAQACDVAFVVRGVAPTQVTFDWKRPPGETARASGGPMIECERDQVSSEGDAPDGRAARRR